MPKKYIVRLSEVERNALRGVIKQLKGSSQKVRRAQILLKADAEDSSWTDARIAEAFCCRSQTVENIRKRLVTQGFAAALNGLKRPAPPTAKLLDGEQEAQVIAMRLGEAPKGYANWSLRLLARKVVELGMVESVSHETVRQTLKKTV
ncbi:helix-turn-helix domain-containing protein [Leptothoe sp. PORK10 BA2]|uniref:helix-turn-helix domain-containing protein n=1 Tax=Leptothoe sp. PORK10 BA2 TaxID=3110254 RepID=UPI002B1F5A29|nr:helix-turn-helix domain-containing protein [Leptothoe sp. PORK10 BA2]MEA5464809.1 helix-turn-helix domain-containing protein [Leptothoe sp. PORK10 BA2]